MKREGIKCINKVYIYTYIGWQLAVLAHDWALPNSSAWFQGPCRV